MCLVYSHIASFNWVHFFFLFACTLCFQWRKLHVVKCKINVMLQLSLTYHFGTNLSYHSRANCILKVVHLKKKKRSDGIPIQDTCLSKETEQINPSFTVGVPETVWEVIWTDTAEVARKVMDLYGKQKIGCMREQLQHL